MFNLVVNPDNIIKLDPPQIMEEPSSKSPTKSKDKSRRKDDGDVQFKVIIIGDSGVGKSCLLTRYIKDTFNA